MNSLIFSAIDWVLKIIEGALFIRVLLSWIPIPRNNVLVGVLYQVTEPILGPIRNLIAKSALGRNMYLDFSPLIAFILIDVARNIIGRILSGNALVF